MNQSETMGHEFTEKSVWRRFSLRTLMLFVLLVAIALGWMRREYEFDRHEKRLADATQELERADQRLKPHHTGKYRVRHADATEGIQPGYSEFSVSLGDSKGGSSLRHNEDSIVVECRYLGSLPDHEMSLEGFPQRINDTQPYSDYYQIAIFYDASKAFIEPVPDLIVYARFQGEEITVLENDRLVVIFQPEEPSAAGTAH